MELIIFLLILIIPLSFAITGNLRDLVLYPSMIAALTLRFISPNAPLFCFFVPVASYIIIYFIVKRIYNYRFGTKKLKTKDEIDGSDIYLKKDNVVAKFEHRAK